MIYQQYRKKPVVVGVSKPWEKHGDHPAVVEITGRGLDEPCDQCPAPMTAHGWIGTLEGGHRVCPGDRIVLGIKGETYPIKPEVFERNYERVGGEHSGPGGHEKQQSAQHRATEAELVREAELAEAKLFIAVKHPLIKEGFAVFVAEAIRHGRSPVLSKVPPPAPAVPESLTTHPAAAKDAEGVYRVEHSYIYGPNDFAATANGGGNAKAIAAELNRLAARPSPQQPGVVEAFVERARGAVLSFVCDPTGAEEPTCAKCGASVNVRPNCDWDDGDLCDECCAEFVAAARPILLDLANLSAAKAQPQPAQPEAAQVRWAVVGTNEAGETVFEHPRGYQIAIPKGTDYLPLLAELNHAAQPATPKAQPRPDIARAVEAADAARWRFVRRFLSIDGEAAEEGGQNYDHVDVDNYALLKATVRPGHWASIDSLIDAALAAIGGGQPSTPKGEVPPSHPRTADGAVAYIGMQVWGYNINGELLPQTVVGSLDSHPSPTIRLANCYSTREAALAAQPAPREGGGA